MTEMEQIRSMKGGTWPFGIYEVSGGGIEWWVSSLTPEGAIEWVLRLEGCDVGELFVKLLPKDAARELIFYDPDTDKSRSMWDEWQHDKAPRVIACSEY